MAEAITIKFSKMRVLLGNGASPEVFSNPCGFNSRSLTRTKNLLEQTTMDCDDDDEPAWITREVESLDWSIDGEGLAAEQSIQIWEDFFDGTDSKNVRVEIEFPGSIGTIIKQGRAHLSNFVIGATRGEKVTTSISLQGDGPLTPVVA